MSSLGSAPVRAVSAAWAAAVLGSVALDWPTPIQRRPSGHASVCMTPPLDGGRSDTVVASAARCGAAREDLHSNGASGGQRSDWLFDTTVRHWSSASGNQMATEGGGPA